MVTAHPFRGVFSQGRAGSLLYKSVPDPLPKEPEDAVGHPIFKLAHAVEIANGGTIDEENDFALRVAGLLGMPVAGGSDAHSAHGLGRFVTSFDDEINNEQEFLAALHSGRYHAGMGLRFGHLRPYTLQAAAR